MALNDITQSMIRDGDTLYHDIVDIYAVTVMLDHKERDRELIEFCHAAMVMNHHLRPNTILSRRKLMSWFQDRHAALRTTLDKDHDDAFKHQLLSRVKDPALQRRVLSSIFTIAVCDYELHDEESDFIRAALKIWKADMPSPDELEVAGWV